ncbi:histidinol-phosphate aminotransferase family protein [Aerococcus agrisoli]|uniref:Histidinol-phosphate aminotransferase family protein n=1 Tax=Aerococcus agrisoli TaxID=2487350 RepID=A0A3N4GQW7_9LACT|nr:histidinol-phosphate transaminase [Aerococcus agrisoli]RPA61010.1 histidinol-phosphate aminotransferase family protein [Aerococcus agrisoli]
MTKNDYLNQIASIDNDTQTIMNRNTSPIRPLSDQAIIEVVLDTPYNQYPEDQEANFKQAYADYNGFNVQNVAVANGSDEWIQKLIIQFGKDGVLADAPDFYMYEDYSRQLGYPFNTVSANENYEFSASAIIQGLDQYKPSILFISNPHNPTGQQFSSLFLQNIADACQARDVIFVIDEAYVEFADDYDRPKNANVVYIRTLSKIYGIAGLRVGIALAKGPIFDKLVDINHPYPINSLSLNLASKLFEDTAKLDDWIDYQKDLQVQLVAAFDQVADIVNIIPSKTNFVYMYGENVDAFAKFMTAKGYIGRTYETDGIITAARYSIIDKKDYPQLAATIKEWRDQFTNE